MAKTDTLRSRWTQGDLGGHGNAPTLLSAHWRPNRQTWDDKTPSWVIIRHECNQFWKVKHVKVSRYKTASSEESQQYKDQTVQLQKQNQGTCLTTGAKVARGFVLTALLFIYFCLRCVLRGPNNFFLKLFSFRSANLRRYQFYWQQA